MSYLMDTHTFLWFVNADSRLSLTAKSLLEKTNDDIYLSVASAWEIAIKVSLKKLSIPTPVADFMTTQLKVNHFQTLPITPAHLGVLATLPFHHRDPFDRLIIAQSMAEQLSIIGKDEAFDLYRVTRIW